MHCSNFLNFECTFPLPLPVSRLSVPLPADLWLKISEPNLKRAYVTYGIGYGTPMVWFWLYFEVWNRPVTTSPNTNNFGWHVLRSYFCSPALVACIHILSSILVWSLIISRTQTVLSPTHFLKKTFPVWSLAFLTVAASGNFYTVSYQNSSFSAWKRIVRYS